eukprot:COSAG02_NODE_1569_length_11894_cov_51.145994_13_plen_122_part_00
MAAQAFSRRRKCCRAERAVRICISDCPIPLLLLYSSRHLATQFSVISTWALDSSRGLHIGSSLHGSVRLCGCLRAMQPHSAPRRTKFPSIRFRPTTPGDRVWPRCRAHCAVQFVHLGRFGG